MVLWQGVLLTLYGLAAVSLFIAVWTKRDKTQPVTAGFLFGLIAVSAVWFIWIPYYGITTMRQMNKDAS